MSTPLVDSTRIETEKVTFAVNRHLPDVMARSAVSLDCLRDDMLREMVYALRYEVLGVALDERVVKYPADWWQAFRARWFPAWWLRRRPVRNTEIRMTLKALYPQLPIDQKPVYHVDIGPPVAG